MGRRSSSPCRGSPQPCRDQAKLALLRAEPALQREADDLIAILVASGPHRSRSDERRRAKPDEGCYFAVGCAQRPAMH
jgi:hypothetical protein